MKKLVPATKAQRHEEGPRFARLGEGRGRSGAGTHYNTFYFCLCVFVFLWLILFLSGCKAEKPERSGSEAKELMLFCGAGIRPPVDELVETFSREQGVKIITDYAGAEVLLSKIELSRQGDLYMPGDREFVCRADEKGLILYQKSVCYFVPAILVQKDNPKKIGCLHDLIKPGIKLGLGHPYNLPVGRIAKEIFEKNKISWTDVEKNLKFQAATVNVLGMQIQAKALDAVIVWDAMARYYDEYGDQVPIAFEKNIISTVDIGVLKFTKHRELAEKFVEFVASEQGRDIFRKHNYTVDPPK